MTTTHVTHTGGCHCGRVRFTVEAPARPEVLDCNCSVCALTGFLHLIVPRAQFQLLAGADDLTEYRFGTGVARHLFCRVCGIKAFYIPRSHPDCVDVNLRCVDPATLDGFTITPFDGRDWERAAAALGATPRDPA